MVAPSSAFQEHGAVALDQLCPSHSQEQGVPSGWPGHHQKDTHLPQLSEPGWMLKETLEQINYLSDLIFFEP